MYLYHRTNKKGAKSILENGFKVGLDKRMECGNGVYTITNIQDCNNTYNRKHYGNYVIHIEIPNNLNWEHGDKVTFMRLTKKWFKNANRIYTTPGTNGTVAVLNQIDKIINLTYSNDNCITFKSYN